MPALPQLNIYYVLILIFIVSFSAFIFALGYSIYYWLHKRHHQTKKGKTTDPRDAAVEEAIKIVEDARGKALGLLQEAHIEAKSILHGTEEVKSSTKEMFEEKMQQLAQKQMQAFDVLANDLLGSYKTALSQEKESSLKTFMDISNALKEQMSSEVRTFAGSLKQVTKDTENTIKGDLKTQYEQVSSEMGNLAENLKKITAEAEESMRGSLGGQYELVQGQIGSLADNIKRATEETENKIKEDITHEYEEVRNVVHDFADRLRQAAIETENTIKQNVKDEYDQVKQELKDYKEDRLRRMDETALGMMEEVARDVLGKTMTAKDHEELILRSLDGIKRTTNLKEL